MVLQECKAIRVPLVPLGFLVILAPPVSQGTKELQVWLVILVSEV
jgi:hypothetical protein